ncbi:MAG: restriction endonuclease subunit S [Flavobacteriia bacterium]|nr:restriction endonuclease subunit S [Flavobacteriia bacterium]
MNWEYKDLIDVCEINLGKTPSRSNKRLWDINKIGNNKWASIADLTKVKGRYLSDTKEYISDEGAKLFNYVKPNTILMSFKLSIGKLAITKEKIYTNEAIVALPIKNNKELNQDFLYYYLEFYDWEKESENDVKVKGKTLNKDKLKKIKIPLPPFPIQQKIVEKLDTIFVEIDKATAAVETNINNAEALFQNFLKQAFKNGGKDWEVFKIKDLIKIRSGDFLPAKNMNSKGSIDVYGGNGISGKHDLQNLSGDNIIIGRVGAKCGNVRLVRGNIWVTDNAFYVSEFKKNINKEFLSLALELENLRTLANQMAQPVISFATIKDTELKIPNSLEKQVKFLKIKNRLELQVKILNDSNIKKTNFLNLLKQSILKKAFNDELVKAA